MTSDLHNLYFGAIMTGCGCEQFSFILKDNHEQRISLYVDDFFSP